MPSELGNQMERSSGGAQVGGHMEEGLPNRLIVLAFEDDAHAESLYEKLKELDKKEVAHLEDAVFVNKGDDGKYKVHEKMHHEKRSGTAKGAVLGTLIGWMLGGPVLGLAGGAIVGRMVGKRMDMGIDKGTIESISNHLDAGKTALFISGSANNTAAVIDAFKDSGGKLIETTIDADVQAKLQQALDEDADSEA
jgi:uncharacterized membrane protein